MTDKPDDPAFPAIETVYQLTGGGKHVHIRPGISTRCYIATAALQGLLANSETRGDRCADASVIKAAAALADLLLAELAKEAK